MSEPVSPGPEHARLAPFAGVWRTSGQMLSDDGAPAAPFSGMDSYEWLPGGFFLLHRVDVDMGGTRVQALEVIGWNARRGTYVAHSYDSQGNTGEMDMILRDGTWTFLGDAERFTGAFSDDGATMSGRWERREDGRWVPWMDVHLAKDGAPAGEGAE